MIVPRGEGLRFKVDPAEGYGIASVTVNGMEVYSGPEEETVFRATPSQAVLKTVKTVYRMDELEEDAEVIVRLEESSDGLYKAEIVGKETYETIQKAIDESADGDTIRILADRDDESVRIEGKELTIDLDGHIWTGMEKDSDDRDSKKPGSVITAEDSRLTIIGSGMIKAAEGYRALTLIDTKLTIGQEDEEGPEILGGTSEGLGILYEEDSQRGGVILALGGEVVLNSGRIADGYVAGDPQEYEAATPSNAGQTYGGGIAVVGGRLWINGGTIENNTVDYGLGGGIYFEGVDQEKTEDIRLDDVTIKENQAQFGGAAAICGSCRAFSITEDTKTYENQALGDREIPGLEARVSDEFFFFF